MTLLVNIVTFMFIVTMIGILLAIYGYWKDHQAYASYLTMRAREQEQDNRMALFREEMLTKEARQEAIEAANNEYNDIMRALELMAELEGKERQK